MLNLTSTIGLDIETNGLDPLVNDILLISITDCDGKELLLDTSKFSRSYFEELFLKIQSANCVVIGQNLKFDLQFIYHKYGVLLTNIWDTLLMSQCIHNGKPFDHSLDEILLRELDINIDLELQGQNNNNPINKKDLQMSFVGMRVGQPFSKLQLYYAACDTKYLLPLYEKQLEQIKSLNLNIIQKLEHKLLPVLIKMELGGCRLDVGGWNTLIKNVWEPRLIQCKKLLDDELVKLSEITGITLPKKFSGERIPAQLVTYDLFGGKTTTLLEFGEVANFGSPKQLIELFNIFGQVPPQKKDKDGNISYSTDEGSLKTYLTENPRSIMAAFIAVLLDLREQAKLISTYGEEFLGKVDCNDYIHTSYSQCFTATGRLSSSAPNLQNIPKSEIRKFFLADPGHKMITSDMSSAEVRIAADYSGEPLLLQAVLDGEDLHSKLATLSYSIIFGQGFVVSNSTTPVMVKGHEFVPNSLRSTHKSVLFAKFYKGGAKRCYEILAKYINLFHKNGLPVAQRISRKIDKTLPTLTLYLSGLINDAQNKGYLRGSVFQRIRYFDKDVYGDAANFPIQNTNAEANKVALIKIDEYLTETGYGRLVLNTHDEVACSVKNEYAEEASKVIERIMSDSLGYFLTTVPGGASCNIAEYWEQ